MTYPLKKYRKCSECGRGFPGAHVSPNVIGNRNDYLVNTYKAHKNRRCPMCIRKEIEALHKNGSREAMTRMCKLQKQMTA